MTPKTEIAIDGEKFYINSRPTYEGVTYRGKPVEGLLMNSRMIQGIFDDDNPETAELWKYPDTGMWDPDRNTDEFCAQMPEYRKHGILAVTVGFQGGGSIYGDVWDRYRASAYSDDGSLKQPWMDRMLRVLKAADEAEMVVIANYLYWKQARFIQDSDIIRSVILNTTEWLLDTGYRNIIVDIANECAHWWRHPAVSPKTIGGLIDLAKSVTRNGRRLLVSSSSVGHKEIPEPTWMASEDLSLPHGNGCTPEMIKEKLREIRNTEEFKKRPRPIVINEDSAYLGNCIAAVEECCSWGYFAQGAGSREKYYDDQWGGERETAMEKRSGYQVVPVNWGINTPKKKGFFDLVKEITQGK